MNRCQSMFLKMLVFGIICYLMIKSRMPEQSSQKILLVTAIPSKACQGPLGDFMHIQSIKNKLEYSRIKDFAFHLNVVPIDPALDHSWNKIALVHRLLNSHLNYDWIIWMDIDTLILNSTFDIPFESYSGYDFVLYGVENLLYNRTDVLLGLNTGIFLIRNDEWARTFFQRIVNIGRDGMKTLKSTFRGFRDDLRDQNAVGYLLYTDMTLRSRTYLERRYTINAYWEMTRTRPEWYPFILHFAGCEFCEGIRIQSRMDCIPIWKKYFNKSYESWPN